MRFFGTVLRRYAEVDTDEGCFRVHTNGAIERWTDDEETHQSDYRWFDEDKYDPADIAQIRNQGLSALGMTF